MTFQHLNFELGGVQLTAFNGLDLATQCSIVVAVWFVITIAWVVLTVKALHRRDLYFWSLSSTWTSLAALPICLLVGFISAASDSGGPWIVAAVMYVLSFAYALLYNSWVTRSVIVGIGTAFVQQLAVLGAIYLWLRLTPPGTHSGEQLS